MSDISNITPASKWVAATAGVVDTQCKAIMVKAGGSITMKDLAGTSLVVAATTDSVYPLTPYEVTAATNAWLLF